MQPTRRSTLFLMELMMAILLFSLAATVCVQVFVKSHTLEKESTDLSHAVFASSSVAEIFRNSDDYTVLLKKEFPLAKSDERSLQIFYDKEWEPVAESEAEYQLLFVTDRDTDLVTGRITVSSISADVSAIYELQVNKYVPREVE